MTTKEPTGPYENLSKETTDQTQCQEEQELANPPPASSQPARKPTKRPGAEPGDNIMKKACAVLSKEHDKYDIFGAFVAAEIRGLSNESSRKKLKRMIQRAILQVTEEDDESTSSLTSTIYSKLP